MIKLSYPIKQEQELALEADFYEWEDCPWMIVNEIKGGVRLLEAYFTSEDEAKESWDRVRSFCGDLPEVLEHEKVEDADWKNEYKKYLKPWTSGELHWVPVWERGNYVVPDGDVAVWFDAGMAFGTGAHETTRLCALRLLEYKATHAKELDKVSLIDAGCGSGILAISAKLLGYGDAYGFDIEEDARVVSVENAQFNGVEGGIRFDACDLAKGLGGKAADVVVANIISEVLCEHAELLINTIKPGGRLILSGILEKELAGVRDCFETAVSGAWPKLSVESRVMGEWADLCLKQEGA